MPRDLAHQPTDAARLVRLQQPGQLLLGLVPIFVSVRLFVLDAQLAEDLTLRGIAVDGVFDLAPRFGAGAGSLFEMDITTNRVDAMNHYGIAREAATIYSLALQSLELTLPGAEGNTAPAFPVRIEEDAKQLCGRFTARVLRGITIQPSSGIVAERFRLLEQKQISNAVDATNFVTQAIGQPTHAFDLDKLTGGIVVRRARKGERLKTLDGVDRALDPEDLVIADEERSLSLAGVMGGWDSMITPRTRNVLVEAAWFDPASIRRSAKRHGLHTDASHRFERGADFNAPPTGSAMVSKIILEAGGTVDGQLIDIVIPEAEARTARRPPVALALGEVHRILGPTEAPEGITASDVEQILTGLGCTLVRGEGQKQILRSAQDDIVSDQSNRRAQYAVTLPSWRLDLEREIDLIEEVARVYGYNRFRNTLPGFAGSVVKQPTAREEAAVRETLLACGFSEALSSTFCGEADAATFAPQPGSAVPMGNPLSEEAGMLRPSLVPGMLAMLALNLNRGVDSVALFELGTVFSGSTEKVDERPALSFGAFGGDADFYALKGTVETLAHRFAARSHYYDRFPADSGLMPAWLHPGRSARLVIDGSTIVFFGQLHPEQAQARKLKQAVFLGTVYLDRLYKQGLRHPMMRELSRYQPVRRDFSFLFPEAVRYAEVESVIRGLALPELTAFAPTEVLREGKLVPEGHYSLLLGATFQSHERTLREEDLQEWSQAVIRAMEQLGGRLRS